MAPDPFSRARSLRSAYGAVDWSGTPLGSPASWSPALKAITDLAFNTEFAVTLLWGPEFTMVYNEAYVPIIGDKHPTALGSPAREVFPEIWDEIGPMMKAVVETGEPVWMDDIRLLMNRHGYPEECFFNFCYSPAGGEDGAVDGVVDIVTETTHRTIAQRRLTLLTTLGQQLTTDLKHPDDVLAAALPVLRTATLDLPAVDIRLPGAPLRPHPSLPSTTPSFDGDDPVVVEPTDAGPVAWVRLATTAPVGGQPVMVAMLSENLEFAGPYRDFLLLIADGLTKALDRIAVRAAEQAAALAERGLSEALQRSLLTPPPLHLEHLEIAVRYQPAAELSRIGGDWYDSFVLPGGTLALAIGDVSGHDRQAAAAMAQVRNVMRGIASVSEPSPATILDGLDRAMRSLTAGTLATAVFARLDDPGSTGRRTLTWSNASHPPPVLVTPSGRATALEADVEVMLGVAANGAARADHTVQLEPGATVVLYTDGLIERRGEDIEASVAGLVTHLSAVGHLPVDQVCDHLLDRYCPTADDDIAMLVLRVVDPSHPE